MTSRDGSNRYGQQPAPKPSRSNQTGQFGVDADELDRYMSGQPAKQPRFDPYGRSQSTGQTRTTRPVQQPQYQPQPEPEYQDWDDQSYDDNYEYDDYEPVQPAPVRPAARQSSGYRNQPVQEYDDDLYEDPYVLDDDDIEERPQRRSSRRQTATAARSFSLPPFIADAPVLKDRMALTMLGTGFASVLLMLIVVAMKRSGLPDAIPTHINANGDAHVVESSGAIWQLPLIAAMVMLISSVLAWFLAKWGAFLPRFLLGGSLGVQFIVWIAVYAFLFK